MARAISKRAWANNERIAMHLTDQQPIEKITFSAYDTEAFVQALEQTGAKRCC